VLAAVHRDLGDAHLLRLEERLADDKIALGRNLILGNDIIGPLVISGVDLPFIDELNQVDRFLAFQLEGLDFFRLKRHVDIGLDLIALDDVAVVNRSDTGDDLLVFDPLARRFVNLIEGDLRLAIHCRIEVDVDRDELQAEKASPIHMTQGWHETLLTGKRLGAMFASC
jgi:hypothetical protein